MQTGVSPGLIAELGVRVGEALSLQVEDVDLTRDDEHLSVLGKGGRRRTVLIDGDGLVVQLRAYLRHTGYRHGPLFRAEKNGRGGPLRYQSARKHWVRYCRRWRRRHRPPVAPLSTRRSSSPLA